jgi:xanthine permease XanP
MTEPTFYGVDDPLPTRLAWLLGIQHVMGMFVGIITPPLIVASALGLTLEEKAFLVSTSLFSSGLTTLVQVHRFGPVGSGLLSVTGPSFVFVPLAIAAGKQGGLGLVFGLSLSCCWIPALAAIALPRIHRFFPPVVTGTAIALIGFSLIQVGFSQFAGGFGAADLGHPHHLLLGVLVLGIIVAAQRRGGQWASLSLALGLVVGTLTSWAMGGVDSSGIGSANWLQLPQFLRYGLSFSPNQVITWAIAYLLVALECIGDLTATSVVSRQPTTGDLFAKRVRGGLLADSLGCCFTAFMNALPKTTFAQNNGIIALTGVAARRAGYCVGIILVLLGLFPKLACLISLIPSPVLGGATLVMFSTVAVTGMKTALLQEGSGSHHQSSRNTLILAIALGLGLGLGSTPHLVGLDKFLTDSQWPSWTQDVVKILSDSGLAVGTLAAFLLNLALPSKLTESVESHH